MHPTASSPTAPRTEGEIVERLRRRGPALVALSGGVDSGLVASLAREALGEQCLAATVVGAAVTTREVERARTVARAIGIRFTTVAGDPLADSDYRRNGADRCYHCRRIESGVLRELGRTEGARQYLDGLHADDLTDDRPGIRAMEEAGFSHPLLWAGWRKEGVRRAARARGLPNWDQPSDACLASRIARGEPVTAELLARVGSAEAVLLDLGFRRVRVRVRSGTARIVVGPEEVERLSAGPLAADVTRRIRALGFDEVSIDPSGYRAGGSDLPVIP